MESLVREKQLYNASYSGDIKSLDMLLKEDKHVLNHYGSASAGFCFNETPLHIATTRGHVDFAKALLRHKPDLVNILDSRLRSPLHLASENGHIEMVKLLLHANSDVLIEDKFGRTPLHLVAMGKGRVEIVNELVRARPEAIMYPLNRMKTITILHSYVIRNGPKALDQFVEVDHTFLNSQDGEGNTILHKVVALKQVETLTYLVDKKQLLVNLKNENSFTALDITEQMPSDSETTEMRKLLVHAGALNGESVPALVSLLEKKKDAILIAATVIAGMAYQAGLNPPGGVWDENKNYTNVYGKTVNVTAGTSVMAANYPSEYILFWAFNTVSFVAALSIVILLIRGTPRLGTTKFRKLKQKVFVWLLTGIVWVTTTTMALTYLVAMSTTAPGFYKTNDHEFEYHRNGMSRIVKCSVLAWLGLVSIVLLMSIFRSGIYNIMNVANKCIKTARRNANCGCSMCV